MVTSLSWASDGSYLAVGNESGSVEIWDVDTAKRMRNMTGHLVSAGQGDFTLAGRISQMLRYLSW